MLNAVIGLTVLWCINAQKLPVVINTWAFVDANLAGTLAYRLIFIDDIFIAGMSCANNCSAAMTALNGGKSSLDAVELGCTAAEMNESIKSVGYGGR